MKYFTIYKTTNIINKKIYIGLHATNDLNDKYLGSGVFLKKAIRKYGTANFKKEILFIYDNKHDMIEKEKELVNEEFVNRYDTYNMSKGGFGLSTLSEDKKLKAYDKIKKSKKGKDYTKSYIQKSNTLLSNDPDCFKKIGAKSAETQRESYRNGYINPRTRFDYIIIYNDQDRAVYQCLMSNLTNFCKEHDLPERALIKSIRSKGVYKLYTTQIPRNMVYVKFKGWYAIYENEQLN